MTEPIDELTWTDIWAEITDQLGDATDARRIIEYASGRMGAPWLVIMNSSVPEGALERVHHLVERRLTGEPLQYVLGQWGFRSLHLAVDKRVLIPRPETEQVVEAALPLIANLEAPIVVDLGTGSGAIGLSIAKEVTRATVFATDSSRDALDVAAVNLARMSESVRPRVHLQLGSWFEGLSSTLRGSVNLIISNPPYVAESRPEEVERVVHDYEPHRALYAGADGLDDLRVIIGGAAEWLAPNGHLVIELAPEQGKAMRELALDRGFAQAVIGKDFVGRERWLHASLASSR